MIFKKNKKEKDGEEQRESVAKPECHETAQSFQSAGAKWQRHSTDRAASRDAEKLLPREVQSASL
jgi:hypothetical protein